MKPGTAVQPACDDRKKKGKACAPSSRAVSLLANTRKRVAGSPRLRSAHHKIQRPHYSCIGAPTAGYLTSYTAVLTQPQPSGVTRLPCGGRRRVGVLGGNSGARLRLLHGLLVARWRSKILCRVSHRSPSTPCRTQDRSHTRPLARTDTLLHFTPMCDALTTDQQLHGPDVMLTVDRVE